MKIIREYVGSQIGSIDLQKSLKKETFLRDQTDGKIAKVTLSFWEKLSCFFQKFFCCRKEIKIKNFTIISASHLKALVTAANKAIKVEEVKPQPIVKVEKPEQKKEFNTEDPFAGYRDELSKMPIVNQRDAYCRVVTKSEVEQHGYSEKLMELIKEFVSVEVQKELLNEFYYLCVGKPVDQKKFKDELSKFEEVKPAEKEEAEPIDESKKVARQGLVNAHIETLKLPIEKRVAYCRQVSNYYVENYGYSKELIEYMKTYLDRDVQYELFRDFTFICYHAKRFEDAKAFTAELAEAPKEDVKVSEIPPAQKVHDLIKNAQLNEALNEIPNAPKEEREGLYIEVAKAHVKEKGYSEEAQQIIKKHVVYDRQKENFKDFVEICCLAGQYEDAKKYHYESDESFMKVAQEEFEKDNLEKVVDILDHLTNLHYDYDKLRKDVGARYFKLGKLDEALAALKNIIYRGKDSNLMLVRLSKEYFKNKQFDKAAQLGIYNENYADLKNFYTRIVENYQEQGEDKKALKVLAMIQQHGQLLNVGHSNRLRDYLKGENPSVEKALNIVLNSPLRH